MLWSLRILLFPGQGGEGRLQVLGPSLAAVHHGESGGDWFAAATGYSLGGPVVAHSGLTAMLIAF